MENTGHAATGMPVGAAAVLTADQIQPQHPAMWIIGVAVGAGAALLNDADHDSSTVVKSGGKLTRAAAEVLQLAARVTYRATRKPCDPNPEDNGSNEHRGLLHTWPFALLTGAGTVIGHTYSPWVGPIMLCVLLAPAFRSVALSLHHGTRIRVPRFARDPVGAALAAIGVAGLLTSVSITEHAPLFGPAFGAVITSGMLTHNEGDGWTNTGTPWKFPFPHWCDEHRAQVNRARCGAWFQRAPWHFLRCEQCRQARNKKKCARWDRSNTLPKRLRFSTGSEEGRAIERRVFVVCLAATAAIVALGLTPLAPFV